MDAANSHGAIHGSVWNELSLALDPNKIHGMVKALFTRAGTLPPQDGTIATYDGFNLHVCTDSCVDTGALLGRIAVSYSLVLRTPQPNARTTLSAWAALTDLLSYTALVRGLDDPDLVVGNLLFNTGASAVTPEWPCSGEFILTAHITGVGLTAPMSFGSCTGAYNNMTHLFLADATSAIVCFHCRVVTGDVFAPALAAGTSVASCSWIIGQGAYADFEHT